MKVYNVLMESFYYDGDDFVIADVYSWVRTFSTFAQAKSCLEHAVLEEMNDGKYTEDMLSRDGEDYACFQRDDGRIEYRITICESDVICG